MRTSKSPNQHLQELIATCQAQYKESKKPLYLRLAKELSKPSRQRRQVNLTRINHVSKENDVVLVPGKVLGSGTLDHTVTIIAYAFSGSAKERIREAKAKTMDLSEFVKSKKELKNIKIVG